MLLWNDFNIIYMSYLELRKLLQLSKDSRGGIVPSSSTVMDMYMVGKVVGVGSYGKVINYDLFVVLYCTVAAVAILYYLKKSQL